ncbi:MAG: PH domain-containing protein [Pseudoxanthomonas sp.]
MSEIPQSPAPPEPTLASQITSDWQHLPRRGARLAALENAVAVFIPCAIGSAVLAWRTGFISPWLLAPLAGLAGAAFGAWFALKRHRRTLWKLDQDGFALQRGRWWHSESRVPVSRVQHLDLKRGPLQRVLRLATLVIHTAGTRMAAVSVSGLDSDDAERLRDRLGRQLDPDDDAL